MIDMLTTRLKTALIRNLWLITQMTRALCGYQEVPLERHAQGDRIYYSRIIRVDGKKKRKYVGKPDSDAVQRIVADKARQIRIGILERNNERIEKLLASLEDDSAAVILSKLPACIREIADSCYLDERLEELKAWAASDYPKNPADFPEEEHYACDGTRVRSKGEVIWYNILYMMGIPFRYDCCIEVADKRGRIRYEYPDFMIQCYDGTFLIIEHFGKLWDDKYLARQAEKIQNYLREGYVLGINFFVTSDYAGGGTNSDAIRRLAELVEERFYGYGAA